MKEEKHLDKNDVDVKKTLVETVDKGEVLLLFDFSLKNRPKETYLSSSLIRCARKTVGSRFFAPSEIIDQDQRRKKFIFIYQQTSNDDFLLDRKSIRSTKQISSFSTSIDRSLIPPIDECHSTLKSNSSTNDRHKFVFFGERILSICFKDKPSFPFDENFVPKRRIASTLNSKTRFVVASDFKPWLFLKKTARETVGSREIVSLQNLASPKTLRRQLNLISSGARDDSWKKPAVVTVGRQISSIGGVSIEISVRRA